MKMNNFVKFNGFVGELVNFVTVCGEIIDFTTNYEEDDRLLSEHVSFNLLLGEKCFIVYYSYYIDNLLEQTTCHVTECDDDSHKTSITPENTTHFDNKDELLTHISTLTLLNCLSK